MEIGMVWVWVWMAFVILILFFDLNFCTLYGLFFGMGEMALYPEMLQLLF